MNRMNISASVNLGSEDSVIECEIDHGNLNFHQYLLGMVRLRKHISSLINSMPTLDAYSSPDMLYDQPEAGVNAGDTLGDAIHDAREQVPCGFGEDVTGPMDEDIKIHIPEDFYSREYDPEIQRHGRRITDTPV
jgi:hypothetical protein